MSDYTFLAASLRAKIEDLYAGNQQPPIAHVQPEVETPGASRHKDSASTQAENRLQRTFRNIIDCHEVALLTQQRTKQAQEITALAQALNEKNAAIDSLQKQLQESKAAASKAYREKERKDDLLKAIQSDINNLRHTTTMVQVAFNQTRAELLQFKNTQNKHTQMLKEKAADNTQKESQVKQLQSMLASKDAKLTSHTSQCNRLSSVTAALRMEVSDIKRSAIRWKIQSEQANALVLELHTRVCEVQSKYSSIDDLIGQVTRDLINVTEEHSQLLKLYSDSACLRDKETIGYLDTSPCSVTTDTLPLTEEIGHRIEPPNIAVAVSTVSNPSTAPQNKDELIRREPRKALDSQSYDVCPYCKEEAYGLMVICSACGNGFHSACTKTDSIQKSGVTMSPHSDLHLNTSYVCRVCSGYSHPGIRRAVVANHD